MLFIFFATSTSALSSVKKRHEWKKAMKLRLETFDVAISSKQISGSMASKLAGSGFNSENLRDICNKQGKDGVGWGTQVKN